MYPSNMADVNLKPEVVEYLTRIGLTAERYNKYILDYVDVEQFICMEEGDYYGIAVMGFDFNVGGIKFASMENTSYAIPTVNFVYEVSSVTEQ